MLRLGFSTALWTNVLGVSYGVTDIIWVHEFGFGVWVVRGIRFGFASNRRKLRAKNPETENLNPIWTLYKPYTLLIIHKPYMSPNLSRNKDQLIKNRPSHRILASRMIPTNLTCRKFHELSFAKSDPGLHADYCQGEGCSGLTCDAFWPMRGSLERPCSNLDPASLWSHGAQPQDAGERRKPEHQRGCRRALSRRFRRRRAPPRSRGVSPRTSLQLRGKMQTQSCNIGALIIRIGVWGPLYYTTIIIYLYWGTPKIVLVIVKAPTIVKRHLAASFLEDLMDPSLPCISWGLRVGVPRCGAVLGKRHDARHLRRGTQERSRQQLWGCSFSTIHYESKTCTSNPK